MVGLPGGRTGKATTDGNGPGSIKSFGEKPGYGASAKKGPGGSNPGPGNGSGSIPKGEALSAKHTGTA